MEQGTWQPATWSQATPGDLVKTSAGEWRIIARSGVSGNMIEMSNAKTGAKVKGSPPADAIVQLWTPDPAPAATDEAIAVIDAEGALGPVEVLSDIGIGHSALDEESERQLTRLEQREAKQIRERVFGMIQDLISNFLYYNRKEDEEFPVESIEQLVNDGVIGVEELTEEFRYWLRAACRDWESRNHDH